MVKNVLINVWFVYLHMTWCCVLLQDRAGLLQGKGHRPADLHAPGRFRVGTERSAPVRRGSMTQANIWLRESSQQGAAVRKQTLHNYQTLSITTQLLYNALA